MIHCLVLGDSIAVGVGSALPQCETVAKVGITSQAYVQTMLEPAETQTLIVSLGANDDGSVRTAENLHELRRTVRAQQVIWLLPGLKDPQRAIIREVAAGYGDRVIDTRPQAGPDHLHPTGMGYRTIAQETEQPGFESEPEEVAMAEEPGFRAARAARLYANRPIAARTLGERTVAERMSLNRLYARRTLRRAAAEQPEPAGARKPRVMAIHATERTTLSDGSQCIRVDSRVSCWFTPHATTLIDPLRDHRLQQPAKSASKSAAAANRRQALAN